MLIDYGMSHVWSHHTTSFRPQSPAPSRAAIRDYSDETLSRERVLLLHGLARTSLSMRRLGKRLTDAGYLVSTVGYPSRRKSVAAAAVTVQQTIARYRAMETTTLHFVTHSLGGIVLRFVFTEQLPDNLGRVVMLSPPNQGSEIVDRFHDWWLFRAINGPAGAELGTRPDSLPNRLGPVRWPTGVITGNRPGLYDRWLARLIPGENDGKVAVERARVEGMRDFLVVPASHSFIMNNREVIRQTIFFLKHGRFDHSGPSQFPGNKET
ncbi:esterase/lipase family protein [Desulfolithobacter sp.]